MKLSAILAPMIAAGVSGDVILATVKAFEEQQTDALERRRANDRERQERRRHVKSRDVTVTVSSHAGVTRVEDNLQTKNSLDEGKEEKKARAPDAREFADFWATYPHKVGKRDAEAAFHRARSRAPFDAIMAGLSRYVAKTDDRPWCNPSTFLNQNRWEDQPAEVQRMAQGPPRSRTIADATADRLRKLDDGQNGTSGNRGDVEFLPPRIGEPRPDPFDVRTGIGRRFVGGNH